MKQEKGSGYYSREFPSRTCLGHPGKDTMYLLKLHISLRPKMLNYFLKLNPKVGYYPYYLIVDEGSLKVMKYNKDLQFSSNNT